MVKYACFCSCNQAKMNLLPNKVQAVNKVFWAVLFSSFPELFCAIYHASNIFYVMQKMAPSRKNSKCIKVGEKRVVTIEHAIDDCVIVSMVFQQRIFSGALLDTTKRYVFQGFVC